MPYRTRPRYQAKVQNPLRSRDGSPAPKGEGRWEPQAVLAALNEMHNAPQEKVWNELAKRGRRAGA